MPKFERSETWFCANNDWRGGEGGCRSEMLRVMCACFKALIKQPFSADGRDKGAQRCERE